MDAIHAWKYFYAKLDSDIYRIHKWLYYSQGLSSFLLGRKLFENDFQAWVYGPVCDVWGKLPDQYYENYPFEFLQSYDDNVINKEERALLYTVKEIYGDISREDLVQMTHQETPWLSTREGLDVNEPSDKVITYEKIESFFHENFENDEDFSDLISASYMNKRVELGLEQTVDAEDVFSQI